MSLKRINTITPQLANGSECQSMPVILEALQHGIGAPTALLPEDQMTDLPERTKLSLEFFPGTGTGSIFMLTGLRRAPTMLGEVLGWPDLSPRLRTLDPCSILYRRQRLFHAARSGSSISMSSQCFTKHLLRRSRRESTCFRVTCSVSFCLSLCLRQAACTVLPRKLSTAWWRVVYSSYELQLKT